MNIDSKEEASRCLSVAIDDGDAVIRVKGRASFIIGPTLKQVGIKLISKSFKQFIVDMEQCESADSTFLGVLAGLSMRLKKEHRAKMFLVNLSKKVYESTALLGLNQIIDCYLVGNVPDDIINRLKHFSKLERIEMKRADTKVTYETIAQAHTNLIQVNKQNLPRFKDVLSFLKEELKDTESSKKRLNL
mgnify:CR=1 FL=1